MILEQYYLACLSHASYLVADESTGVAAIVDPRRDVDEYVRDAEARGLSIRHVVLTHLHADFVAGHLELRERCGARIHLGEGAAAEFDHEVARDGDVIRLGRPGRVKLAVLATPGHTPESVSLVVSESDGDAPGRPRAVLTGDTLFIGDVGRPDLVASTGATAEDLASRLHESLQRLLALPDDTLVYPAHGAGSACGKNLSAERVSTIGDQRRLNPALQPMSREAFVALVTSDLPPAPRYFGFDADLNRRERATLEAVLRAPRGLSARELLALVDEGCLAVDTREAPEFARGHLEGSVNIGLSGRYASWAGTTIDAGHPLVLVAEPGRERESIVRLGRIGFDQVAGWLEGGYREGRNGIPAARVRRWARVDASELARRLAGPDAPFVVDVRGPREREAAAIDGSVGVPLDALEQGLAVIPRGRDVVALCGSGYRSSIAASLLERNGYARVTDLEGGITAWQAAGLPVRGDGAGASCRVGTSTPGAAGTPITPSSATPQAAPSPSSTSS